MTPEQIQRVELLETRVGYAFPDRSLALTALTHKSWVNENRDAGSEDNERLEFLGDAVVDLAVSWRLMERLPEAREGEMSRIRASLVSTDALAPVARELGLGDLLRLGKGEESTGGRAKQSLLANTVEAVVGAVYLADGLGPVMDFVDRFLLSRLDLSAPLGSVRDYKTRLQEQAQSHLSAVPRYKVVGETGPDHAKVFEIAVVIGGKPYGRGAGRSKKEAEQAAAREALAALADPTEPTAAADPDAPKEPTP